MLASHQVGVVEVRLAPVAAVAEGLQVQKVVRPSLAARDDVIHASRTASRVGYVEFIDWDNPTMVRMRSGAEPGAATS